MPRFYRRRYRSRRYRPVMRARRRIGYRRSLRSRYPFRRTNRRYLRPQTINARARPHTTYDRTPNFPGDATLAQFRDQREYTLLRTDNTAPGSSYYVGDVLPGSHLSSDDMPTLTEYTALYQDARVVKCTVVAEFVNMGDTMKNVGIMQLPAGVDGSGLPSWTGSQSPLDQPRCSYQTLGPKTSSRSVRKIIATGTPISASGDTTLITSRSTELDTADYTVPPTTPWYFYVWQGYNTQGNTETAANGVIVRTTAYYTIKFFNRKLVED